MSKVYFKLRDIKGNIIWKNKDKKEAVFMEDFLKGKFIFSIPENVTNEIGIDPYNKNKKP